MRIVRILAATAAALTVPALVACSGADPQALNDDGRGALARGDAKSALERFDAALARSQPGDREHFRAAMSRCEALALLGDLAARPSFLELARREPERVLEDDYSIVCGALLGADATLEAIEVMKAGHDRFPESARMKAMVESVLAAARREETEGDPEAVRRLMTMGYI
jgi:hypothetical protein